TDLINFQLATAQKILADELFLAGETGKASSNYAEAEKNLGLIRLETPDVDGSQRQLLMAEIQYRKKLVEAGYWFLGGAYMRKPINPVKAYSDFIQGVDSLNSTVAQVIALLDKAQGKDAQVTRLETSAIEQQKNGDVESLNRAKAAVTVQYQGRQLSILNERKS